MVKTLPSSAGGMGSIPGWGTMIPHATWSKNQNIKQKQYCNKFNKDFKKGPPQKKKKRLKKKKKTNWDVEMELQTPNLLLSMRSYRPIS